MANYFFFEERFFELFFEPFFEPFLAGTFAPSLRACDKPIAIASAGSNPAYAVGGYFKSLLQHPLPQEVPIPPTAVGGLFKSFL